MTSSINRRDFLRLSGLVASALTLAACQQAYRTIGGPVEELSRLQLDPLPPGDFAALNRMTFGPRLSEQARVHAIGLQGWIEEQLAPETIDDAPLNWRLRPFDILHQTADDIYTRGERLFDGFDPQPILADLRAATLLRQVYSRRQLYEIMVDFWTDHFNISMEKEDVWYLKPVDDREVIRAHALGNFRDLLQASAHSPAMLVYLDNQVNEARAPNENYAREVMELHTLGVNGGYTQQDVMELARCLTGWTVKTSFWRGEFEFNPDLHDRGVKHVLGMQIDPAGQREAELVLDTLALHPATANHLAEKLARRFIADEPPAALVRRTADAFLASKGDIKTTLRTLLLDGLTGLGDNLPPKFKRPGHFIAASLRSLNAETDGRGGEGGYFARVLSQLGQPPFLWPTPDGPPDTALEWMGNLLPRWNYAARLARNQIDGTSIDIDMLVEWTGADSIESFLQGLSPLLLGAALPRELTAAVAGALRREGAGDNLSTARVVIAGMLSSPAFQWR